MCNTRTQTNTRPSLFFIPFPRCSFLLFFPFLPFPCSSFALDPCRPPRQHIRNRAAPPPPPTTSPPFRHPQQPPTREPTATRSTDEQQHTTATPSTASGRDDGAHSPVWHASLPEPRALGAQPGTLARYALGILPRKVVTTSRHRATLQCGGCPFSFEVCSKSQFSLTVKNLTSFQGFGLRIAIFWKFGF